MPGALQSVASRLRFRARGKAKPSERRCDERARACGPRSRADARSAVPVRKIRAVRTETPWPNLFVVGAAKAGTTSLWRYLGAHPAIFMTGVKEPHFFSRVGDGVFPIVHDEASYLSLFANARTPLRGEASPSYLWSEAAARRIREASPQAKIVIALRDPVERLHSWYWQKMHLGLERDTFAQTVARLEDDPEAPDSMYRRSLYTANVRRYLTLFGDDVHVTVFEELVRDVGGQMAAVFAFLGVDHAVARRIEPDAHNPFVLPRIQPAARLLKSRRARRIGRRLVPLRLRGPIESMLVKPGTKPDLDPDTDRWLIDFFRTDVNELAALLGRPLPWARWPEVTGSAPAPRARLAG